MTSTHLQTKKTFHHTRSLNPHRADENFVAQLRSMRLTEGKVHAMNWVGRCGDN